MIEYHDKTLGLTVREFNSPVNPFLKVQIGRVQKVHRSAESISRILPFGYSMQVPVFHVLAFGKNLRQAKARLNSTTN